MEAGPRMSGALRETGAMQPFADDAPQDDLFFTLSPELLTVAESRGEGAHAIQALAGQVIAHHLEAGHRGLAVCGPSRGVGVTFIAANLAIALAQMGVPTLLLDANLHDPGLERLFQPNRATPGLQQLLRDETVDRLQVEQVDLLPDLSIIFSGGAAADGSELIGSAAFRRLIDGCLRDYAFTVIDTPAANRSADPLAIAKAVGHSLIVGRRDRTYVDDAETLARELTDDGVRVLGALMNG